MSESGLISLRFLARVERSLLKRLSGDIHPHLQRVADHAHSKEEFLASAARLLTNPREREQWLATWMIRLRAHASAGLAEGADSGVSPLDSAPAPLDIDTASRIPLDAPLQRKFQVNAAQRKRLHEALARELGPGTAAGLLENEIRHADTAGELLSRLQTHLDNDSQRLRFVNSAIATLAPET